MSVSGLEQFHIRSRLQKVSAFNSMRSKVIPSWKVQNGAQTDTHTHRRHHFLTPWSIIVCDYLYSHRQKGKQGCSVRLSPSVFSGLEIYLRLSFCPNVCLWVSESGANLYLVWKCICAFQVSSGLASEVDRWTVRSQSTLCYLCFSNS